MTRRLKVNILFNANKAYDRQIVEGIGEYIHANQCNWDVFFEEDFTTHLDNIKNWKGDGIIADLDDPSIAKQLAGSNIPVVGVGGSYEDISQYPAFPYIATNNKALIETAFHHLQQKGLNNFAFYGLPTDHDKRWASEREKAFRNITKDNWYSASVFLGNELNSQNWQYGMNRLADWIQSLPKPIGIVAVTDSRARHILQICESLNILIPEMVSVIGIDNEELTQYLSPISLSSVAQGTNEMGYLAGKKLDEILRLKAEGKERDYAQNPDIQLVQPSKVVERQSTAYQALKNPHVIQAIHFIHKNACKGIKVEQVCAFVGISRSSLEQKFKEECGISLHQEIHNSKLNKACNLLKTTALPMAEIAKACGYPSLQYMYTVFNKNLHKTPKDYREEDNSQPIQIEPMIPPHYSHELDYAQIYHS
ncbi:MAG: XylR family transcriptional regulator [Vibrio sp.]